MKMVPVGGGGLNNLIKVLAAMILGLVAANLLIDTLTPYVPLVIAVVVGYVLVKAVLGHARRW